MVGMFNVTFTVNGKPFEPENLLDEVIKAEKDIITKKLNAAMTREELVKLKLNYDHDPKLGLKLSISGPQELTEKARVAIAGK